jgi:alpha-N-arabinofuranosidase
LVAAESVADTEIVLRPQLAGATISSQIYGHFIEHLGGVIYDGIWVGRDSKIPHVEGIRRQFIEDLKAIGAPNFRWPGGCFADGYHWRDGIGPAEKRPRTYNYWQQNTPQEVRGIETNQFGTHEFMRLCRLTGAQPYVAGNVGSGTNFMTG